jgi:hypothetical protein
MQMRRGKAGKRMINTRHILFVVSGAFTGLAEIIEKRLSERNVGFGAATIASRSAKEDVLSQVTTRDFVDYGFEPEFIGRLPIRVALQDLTEDDLFQILTSSEGSILKQHRENFKGYGIDVDFEEEALHAVAARAIQEKTGARGLMTVLESSLRSFKFHLPGTKVYQLVIHRDVIENTASALKAVMADPDRAATEFAATEVRRFEREFEELEGVKLALDDSSMTMAIAVAKELHLSIPDYLLTVFGSHGELLKRMQAETGLKELTVTPRVLNRPEDGREVWCEQARKGSTAARGRAS